MKGLNLTARRPPLREGMSVAIENPAYQGAACDFGGCAYSEQAIMLGYSSLNERQIPSGIERIPAAVDAA